MDPACLTDEEINYELALRHVSNLSALPRRARAARLRVLIEEDTSKQVYYDDASYVMDEDENIKQCQRNTNEILLTLDTALQKSDLMVIRQARSRLFHYRERLAIIEPSAHQLDTHTSLALLVQFALEDIDDALGKGKKTTKSANRQDVAVATGAVPKTTHTTSRAEADPAATHMISPSQPEPLLGAYSANSPPGQDTLVTPQLIDLDDSKRYAEKSDQRYDLLARLDNRGKDSLDQRITAATSRGVFNMADHPTPRVRSFDEYPPPPYAATNGTPTTKEPARLRTHTKRMGD